MLEKETLSSTRSNDLMPFIGVVENTSDPMQIGRVQVRAVSVHPEQNDGGVPTADLPWAYVLLPTTASGTSGIGSTHGLLDGSWVFGWFMDGRDAQQPFIVGTFVGAPGMSSLQQSYVDSKLSVSSAAPGGLGGAFQTMLASAAGGLGPAGKFGSSIGSLLGLGNLLKNDDAVKTLTTMAGIGASNAQTIPPLAAVMDRITSSKRLGTLLSGAQVAGLPTGLGAAAIGQLSDMVGGILSAGGAGGFTSGSANPLSSASFGTSAKAGEEVTGSNLTVATQVDYDLLAASAPSSTGMVTIHSSGTPKHARFSLEPSLREGKSGYHLAIDQTGQILKLREMSSQGSHSPGMDSISAGGQSMGNLGVLLVGGYPTSGDPRAAGLNARFFPVQLEVLDKLLGAFVKKFPKMVIGGGNEIGQTQSPGFNASDWASIKYPNNVNTTRGGEKKISGLSSSTVGAATKSAVPVVGTSRSNSDEPPATTPDGVLTGNRKGFVGGPVHPLPSYAAKKQSDVPAITRVNALTTGRGTSSQSAGSGGPEQQYLAKIEDPTQFSFKEARRADTLNARAQHTQWKVPVYPHGGEYGQAHMVRATEGGHHILLDDTSGRQKVEIVSASGSMIQIHADGSGIFYMKGDTYDLTIGKRKLGINGDFDVTVGGNMSVSVQGDLKYDVTGKILFNGASDMTELIRGNRNTITEGSHLFQAKKNATHRVAKDLDFQVGGKKSERVRGDSHDSIDGNMARTIRGEDNSYVQGNKSSLVMGTQANHAAHMINQSQNEMLSVAGGNFIASAKGRATMIGDGDVIMSTSGSFTLKAAGITLDSSSTFNAKSTGEMHIGPGAPLHLYSSSTIFTSTPLNDGATAATGGTGANTATVEAPPAQLTRESNPASSDANLNAEQVTKGSGDAAEGETTEQSSGGSSSSTPTTPTADSSSSFQEATQSGQVSPSTLGNRKARACDIANGMVARGWSEEGASAITGHMIQESGLSPAAYNPNDLGKPAAGLVAWRGSRLDNLVNYARDNGKDVNAVSTQLDFADWEARNTHSGMGGAGLISGEGGIAQTIKDGANFERFVGWKNEYVGGEWHNRAGDGLAVYNECFGNSVESVGGIAPSNIDAFKGGSADAGSAGGSNPGTPTGEDYTQGTGTSIAPAKGIDPPASTIHSTAGGIDYAMRLSPNFTLGQLTPTSKFREGPNETGRGTIGSDAIVRNLSGCAMNVLEPLLAHFGHVYVNSGYRSKAYNRQVGGVPNSDHMLGEATDVMVTGVPPRQVADWIERNLPNIAGLGRYPGFTHISFKLDGNGGRIRKWGHN